MKIFPPKWAEVYPHGTKEGDEEVKLFNFVARNPKYNWISIAAIIKSTGLSKDRVSQILWKYHKNSILIQNVSNEDLWAYWERVPDMIPEVILNIAEKDKKKRIEN